MSEDDYLSSSLVEQDVDVGAYHVGMVYGKALLAATDKAGNTDEVVDELDELIAMLVRHPKIDEAMASGLISNDDKVAMVDRVFGGRVTATFLNFLKVVAAHGRGGYLKATTTSLEGPLVDRIRDQLRGMLGSEPVLSQKVDPALIGGVIFRVGDTVYDGSVARQLAQVRNQMIDRSIHEIQRRRDRLGHPAGN
jgi:F-type H+-transporting ATPase subunit delta